MTTERAWCLAGLPEGYDPTALRELSVLGQVQIADPDKDSIAIAAAVTNTAGPALIGTDGRPTILRVAAWMLHTDVVNANGDFFVREEIEAMAPTLFRAPNFGVMDWNHAAVLGFNDDPPLMGVWYRAEFAFDQAANDGQGAWGLLVTGMMFAWLFPEQANEMIADQERNGSVRFSMACIPGSTEFRTIEERHAAVLHNPVFFTNSALNRPNADADANGLVSEDPTIMPSVLEQRLLLPNHHQLATAGLISSNITWVADTATLAEPNTQWIVLRPVTAATQEELTMPGIDEKEVTTLKAEKDAAEARAGELAAKLSLAESRVNELTGERDRAQADLDVALADIEALKTTVAELTTARDALVAERDRAVTSAEAAAADIETMNAELNILRQEQAARAQKEVLAARLASLPEDFLAVHNARDEATRARLEEKWVAFETDEQWEEYKKHELLGYTPAQTRIAYRTRSDREGALAANGSVTDIAAKLKAALK